MFKAFKTTLVLSALCFSSLSFAMTNQFKLDNSDSIEIAGDVFNQNAFDIFTTAEGFSPAIKPHSFSKPFKITAGPFTRVVYKDAKGEHGCVFEFSLNGMGSVDVNDYPISVNGSCQVYGSGDRMSLVVG